MFEVMTNDSSQAVCLLTSSANITTNASVAMEQDTLGSETDFVALVAFSTSDAEVFICIVSIDLQSMNLKPICPNSPNLVGTAPQVSLEWFNNQLLAMYLNSSSLFD
jgi:hypothetical protein